MVRVPYSPWGPVTAQAPTAPRRAITNPEYLEGTVMALFAPIYAGCAALGVPATVVDEMEVWQVASTLRVDMNTTDPDDAKTGDAATSAMAARRARALRAKGRV